MGNLSMGCNYVFSIGQRVDQMGKMSKEHDWGNNQKRAKKGCMPFYYCPRSSILEVVSTKRNRTIRKEEINITTIGEERRL